MYGNQYLLFQSSINPLKGEPFWATFQNTSPSQVYLHGLIYHASDGVRRLPFHPLGGVGVGVQGKPRAVVAQSVGESFHVYAVLQRQGGERMSEVVESCQNPSRTVEYFSPL